MTEQQPTTENSSEKPPAGLYDADADSILLEAGAALTDERGMKKLDAHLDSFLTGIIDTAEKGEIKGSTDNVYTADELTSRFKLFKDRLVAGVDIHKSLMVIPSSNGMREAFFKLASSDVLKPAFFGAIDLEVWVQKNGSGPDAIKDHESMTGKEVKREELLSPDEIKKMGNTELDAAEVQDPSESEPEEVDERPGRPGQLREQDMPPSRQNPFMFEKTDKEVPKVHFAVQGVDGQGTTAGYYPDENGTLMLLIEPDATFKARYPNFGGTYIRIKAEESRAVLPPKQTVEPSITEAAQRMVSEDPLTLARRKADADFLAQQDYLRRKNGGN